MKRAYQQYLEDARLLGRVLVILALVYATIVLGLYLQDRRTSGPHTLDWSEMLPGLAAITTAAAGLGIVLVITLGMAILTFVREWLLHLVEWSEFPERPAKPERPHPLGPTGPPQPFEARLNGFLGSGAGEPAERAGAESRMPFWSRVSEFVRYEPKSPHLIRLLLARIHKALYGRDPRETPPKMPAP